MPQHTSHIRKITAEHLSSAEWQVIQIVHYSEVPGAVFTYSQQRTDANSFFQYPMVAMATEHAGGKEFHPCITLLPS